MTIISDIAKELEKFGLSKEQAKIYMLLVREGELRIQDIVKLAHIPRSSVYEHLEPLFELGLIEKIIDDKFVRIKSYPLSSLKHGLNEKISSLQTLIADVDGVEKSIAATSNTPLSGQTAMRFYRGVSGARQLFWNSLNAKSCVYVYSSFGRSAFVGRKFYTDFVAESKERKIKERVLVNPNERTLEFIRKDDGSPVARTKTEDIRVIEEAKLHIKGETFIYDNIYAQVTLHTDEITGFEIESSDFTNPQRSVFEILWNIAKPLVKEVL